MKKITFLATSSHRSKELSQLAVALKSLFSVTIIIQTSLPQAFYDELERSSISFVGKRTFTPSAKKRKYLLLKLILKLINYCSLLQFLREVHLVHKLKRELKCAQQTLEQLAPDFLLINGDRDASIVPAYLKAAASIGIKTIIPYFTYSGKEGPLQMRREHFEYSKCPYSTLYTRYVFKKFSTQVLDNTLFYPPPLLMALSRFGTLPTYPWINGTGLADIVCANNEYTRQLYIDDGVPGSKIIVTGDFSTVDLFESYISASKQKASFEQKYNLSNKEITIISLPQLGEHQLLSWERHWDEINYLVQTVSLKMPNTLLSLHPRMSRSDYIFLENKYNVKILDESLAQVLPLADNFFATYSSTVLWSVLCGKRTIIFDFYNLNYRMFDFLKTPVTFKNKDDFNNYLNRTSYPELNFEDDWAALSRDTVFNDKIVNNYFEMMA